MRKLLVAALALCGPFILGSLALAQQRTPSAAGAEVYIIGPKDGATVHNPVHVQQTETTLTLSPGKHTLQLLLADANHMPHEPPLLSKRITVTVAQ